MNTIHVLGIGSPFGDDRIGWFIVNHLQKQSSLQPFIQQKILFEQCDRPHLSLIEKIQGVESVLLIDAIKSDKKVGTLHRLTVDKIPSIKNLLSSHGFGLGETIQLAKVMNILPKKLLLFGIEINSTHPKKSLSPSLLEAIPGIIRAIESELLEWANKSR